MKYVFSRFLRSSRGTTSMETIIVMVPFFLIFLMTIELGRFFITFHSVRTLASELARQTLLYCASQPTTSVCTLPATTVASTEANVPFLGAGDYASTPSVSRSVRDSTTGVMTITATVIYNFDFLLGGWKPITQIPYTTQISY